VSQQDLDYILVAAESNVVKGRSAAFVRERWIRAMFQQQPGNLCIAFET
jgi:hypothetical protein